MRSNYFFTFYPFYFQLVMIIIDYTTITIIIIIIITTITINITILDVFFHGMTFSLNLKITSLKFNCYVTHTNSFNDILWTNFCYTSPIVHSLWIFLETFSFQITFCLKCIFCRHNIAWIYGFLLFISIYSPFFSFFRQFDTQFCEKESTADNFL